MRLTTYLLLIGCFLLTSCYAYEMQLKDPLLDFKQNRIKNIVILPFETEHDFKAPDEIKTLAYSYLKKTFCELESVKIVPQDTTVTVLQDYSQELWDLPPALIKSLGQKAQADLIITGKIRYMTRIEPVPGHFQIFKPEIEMDKQSTNIQIEMQIATQYWDTQNGKLVLFNQQTLRDISLSTDRQQLQEKMVRLAMRRITEGVHPYYVYR